MAKGFFDLQINGYMGVDFHKDDMTAEELHKVCQSLVEHGVDGILATITTEHVDSMCRRLANITRFRADDKLVAKVIAGFHIEGPFLN